MNATVNKEEYMEKIRGAKKAWDEQDTLEELLSKFGYID